MKDWSSKLRTFDVEKPRLFSAPTSPTGTFEERKGYIVRTRGDTEGMIKHEYVCPVHGKFDAMVPRRDVPESVPCPEFAPLSGLDHTSPVCRHQSPWAGAAMGIGVSAGEVSS